MNWFVPTKPPLINSSFFQSGPQGVAPLDRANSSKPVSSGRGQRHLKIKEQRMANKRALLNPPPSSLSMIQKDIAQSNVLPGT
jgi:hypothetical protein